MTDLEQFRDHARAQAAKTHSRRCTENISAPCHGFMGLGCEHCQSPTCAHACHPRDDVPTEAERRLWTALADEVDRWLAGGDEGQGDLFGGAA